jgi:hypothetical protein
LRLIPTDEFVTRAVATTDVLPSTDNHPGPRLRWLREVVIVATFYGLYTLVRDIRGERPASVSLAFGNARHVISVERVLGIFHESWVQHLFIHDRPFMRFWDGFYGTMHFLVVIGVLMFLFFRRDTRYRVWRNTLALATGLALVGFALFPLMPPRLLPAPYHFVDSLRTIGGLWDFRSGAVDEVSNQYAAMPSLHTAWSAWCVLALWPVVRTRWGRALLVLYPAATVFCIVVTGNHYFADVIGGLLTLAAGYGGARLLTGTWSRLRLRWYLRRPAAA